MSITKIIIIMVGESVECSMQWQVLAEWGGRNKGGTKMHAVGFEPTSTPYSGTWIHPLRPLGQTCSLPPFSFYGIYNKHFSCLNPHTDSSPFPQPALWWDRVRTAPSWRRAARTVSSEWSPWSLVNYKEVSRIASYSPPSKSVRPIDLLNSVSPVNKNVPNW